MAVDGSLYLHFHQFRELMVSEMKALVPQHDVKFHYAEDGSGIGGAVTAAVAVRQSRIGQNGLPPKPFQNGFSTAPLMNGNCV